MEEKVEVYGATNQMDRGVLWVRWTEMNIKIIYRGEMVIIISKIDEATWEIKYQEMGEGHLLKSFLQSLGERVSGK